MSCEHHFLFFLNGGEENAITHTQALNMWDWADGIAIPTKNPSSVSYSSMQTSTLETPYDITSGLGLTTPRSPILESRNDSTSPPRTPKPPNLAGSI